jgi:hypothetical protein
VVGARRPQATSLAAWRRRNLALVAVGAVCGALATQQQGLPQTVTTVLGLLGAVVLALAALVQGTRLNAQRVRDRITARAASETTKSAVYQYLAGVPPYDGPNRDEALDSALADITQKADGLAGEVILATPTPRPLPSISGVADYVTQRAREQRSFHADRIAHHQRLERRWRDAETAATVVAAVLSAIGGALSSSGLSAWVGVATTVAAALAAHLASVQHGRIAASYGITVDDLDRLLDRFDAAAASAANTAEFVTRVEAILAKQNDSWVVMLAPQP